MPGEITPLSKLVQPHIAMITTVAPVHLENLGSLDAIAAAKAEIFDGLLPGGTAVIHGDIEHTPFLKERALEAGAGRVMTFGHGAGNDAELMQVALHARLLDGRSENRRSDDRPTRSARRASIWSSTRWACWRSVRRLSLISPRRVSRWPTWSSPMAVAASTSSIHPGDAITLLDESYNANPASVKAALKVLSRLPTGQRGRRIAVLGDMLELGDGAAAMHGALVYDLTALGVDKVYACGPLMKSLWRVLPMEKRGAYAETSLGCKNLWLQTLRLAMP
jgi:UDP-N-acetylmuramoyl-tripeptide--D-alanyl-D-alanine ligase